MIHRVFANKPTFREVRLTPGLNIILAERTEAASAGDSRNGVGKSTLLDIIHFCFGASSSPGKGLRIPELESWAFSVELDLAGSTITATRHIDEPGRIVISYSDDGWPIQPRHDDDNQELSYSLEQWKTLLGWALFGLPTSPDGDLKYLPSFRSLFSYSCRRSSTAYSTPFKHFPQQPTWDVQIHIAFLLGLSWRNASRWQQIREELEGLTALKKAAKSGVVSGFVGTEGELEAQRVELESRLEEQQVGISTFRVHPEYERLQNDANKLTQQIQDLAKRGLIQRRKNELYTQAITDETPPEETALETMYREAGVTLGNNVLRTLDDAYEFHRKIVSNRQEYLTEEISRLEVTIQHCDRQIRVLSDERAALFEVLQTHGAFDEFSRLNEELSRTRHDYESVMERLSEVIEMKQRRQELRSERVEVERAANRDYSERRSVWSRAVRLFNDNSESLYDSPGRLVIDVGEAGFEFSVEIERSGSEGIAKMEVFCFDLMLSEHLPTFGYSPGFLIHDSLLFDGVDSRQRARALQRAADRAAEAGFQYICTMNTDMVPREDFDEGFEIEPFTRMTLHDGDESGSLLGIRF